MDPYGVGYVQLFPYGVEIPNRVFVGAVPFTMTELELKEFFSQFGNVKDSKIITDRKGISKGYGFVTFDSEEEAIAIYSKGSFYYQGKKLNVARAVRKQGGQYSKANQEYMNGQRLIYMHPSGYLMSQQDGVWVFEQPNPHSEPAKPFYNPYVMAPPSPYMQTTVASPCTPTGLPVPPTPISQAEVYSTLNGYAFTTQATPLLSQPHPLMSQEPLTVETSHLPSVGSGRVESGDTTNSDSEPSVSNVKTATTSEENEHSPEGITPASDVASLAQQTESLSLDTESPEGSRLVTLEPQEGSDEDAKSGASNAPKPVRENGLKRPRHQRFRLPLLNGFPPHTVGSNHYSQRPFQASSNYHLLSGPPLFHGPTGYHCTAPFPQTIRPPHPHYPGPAPSLTFNPPISPSLGAM